MAITFLTFGAYSTIMPYAKREDNFYALAAQAIIFFNLMSSLAKPLGTGMDIALSSLLIGFTILSVLFSVPSGKTVPFGKKRAKAVGKRSRVVVPIVPTPPVVPADAAASPEPAAESSPGLLDSATPSPRLPHSRAGLLPPLDHQKPTPGFWN